MPHVSIIGAGLAGSEAALVLARAGVEVELFEMRPEAMTPAHRTAQPAELVCSNSFKAYGTRTAHGLLKDELALLDSPLPAIALECRVPAGSALAVDRERFSARVDQALEQQSTLRLVRRECSAPQSSNGLCIIAAGPLVSESLAGWLANTFSHDSLYFYDAIAPIVAGDSVDTGRAFFASRNEAESTDYLNCPFTEEEYRRFYDALREADRVVAHEFEDARFFEACLPIEVVAERGYQAPAFGILKPIGLVDPSTGKRPFAVCQLRRENPAGDSYSMVGFQTRMRVADQKSVFRLIPGLEHAEFLRYGSIHRNTYMDSPRLLQRDLSFTSRNNLFLAGQISGSEGYTESIATGHLAALSILARLRGEQFNPPPETTALGSLLRHITVLGPAPFSPSNINFGLLPSVGMPGRKRIPKREKKRMLCERALRDLKEWAGV